MTDSYTIRVDDEEEVDDDIIVEDTKYLKKMSKKPIVCVRCKKLTEQLYTGLCGTCYTGAMELMRKGWVRRNEKARSVIKQVGLRHGLQD